MNDEPGGGSDAQRRVPSGIAGLDLVLEGGFFPGGIYLVAGQPGAGKTILGNQICFNNVERGARCVYLTLLVESHGKLLQHMSAMSFFKPERVPERIVYV